MGIAEETGADQDLEEAIVEIKKIKSIKFMLPDLQDVLGRKIFAMLLRNMG